MIYICEYCNKSFNRTKAKAERSKHKYCSKECSVKAHNQKVEKICVVCGKKYLVKPHAKNITKTCSKKCRGKLRRTIKTNQIIIKDTYAEIIIKSKKFGTKIAIIDKEDIEKINKYTWYLQWDKKIDTPYVVTKYREYINSSKRTSLKLHRVITNCPENLVVDHINHNTLDNRKENLKICTQFENMKNNKSNTSGHVGVYWHNQRNKWCARIKVGKKNLHLGLFININDAIQAREEAELKYYKQ